MTCPLDCGPCPVSCGDNVCNMGETCMTCPQDCGACPISCGDLICNGAETCATCPQDCGSCPAMCGDFACDATESCMTCPQDCGSCPAMCGDLSCDATESCMTCPQDCGPCANNCSHSECATGAALVSGCSACATQVCANDSYCCTTSWDSLCVSEVATYCGVSCPPVGCAHNECVTGVALTSGCSACAAAVCLNDSFCCTTTWDSFCVIEVDLYCAFSCP